MMGKTGSDGNNLRHMNTLGGGDIDWLLDDEVKNKDVLQYSYPPEEEMAEADLQITFLGYFWKNWSLKDNGTFAALRGLHIRKEAPQAIGDYVGVTALDEDWVTLNQMIKYLKFGFGRATDYANEDIRNGLITREKAIEIVSKYDGTCSDKYIKSFCDYIEITEEKFWDIVGKNVNTKLFEKDSDGKWIPKFKVGERYNEN